METDPLDLPPTMVELCEAYCFRARLHNFAVIRELDSIRGETPRRLLPLCHARCYSGVAKALLLCSLFSKF